MKRQIRKKERPKVTFQWPQIKWPHVSWLIWVLLGLAVLLLSFNLLYKPKPETPEKALVSSSRVADINLAVTDILKQFGVADESMTVQDSAVSMLIPRTFDFFSMYGAVREALQNIDAEIIDCRQLPNGSIVMTVGEKKVAVANYIFTKTDRLKLSTGRAAIIIDDFGYSFNNLVRELLTMDFPFTVSIIPGLAASSKVANIALLHNKEILVHMPMEPLYEKYDDNGFTLVVGQDPGLTSLRIRQAFSELPMAIGLNNHQGSRATADPELMKTVMKTLASMDKFYIDSRTNSKSIAYRTARQFGLKCSYNRFFLDAKDEEDFILHQLDLLGRVAKEEGDIIAIGHPRRRTVAALRDRLPKLQAMGIRFVPVSELVK